MRARLIRLETCEVDLDRRIVRRDPGGDDTLTWQEGELLAYLARRPGEPVSREELLREVWRRSDRALPTRAVDIAVRRLREKIERVPSRPRHLVTQRGSGYRFEPALPQRTPLAPERAVAPGEEPAGPDPQPVEPSEVADPAERDRFVGREQEAAAVEQLAGSARRVALVGPAGIGKSRLAEHLAERWQRAGRAVWFVDLHAARSSADLVQRVSEALRLPQDDGSLERLGRALASRGPATLVLDSVEQVPAPEATLDPLLALAPELEVLLTSRAALDGVRQVEVGPLPEADGVRLLLERAHRARAGWGRDADEVVRRIVIGLDAVPLALELAAARAPVLSPAMLLRGLEDRFRLLTGATTLYGALDWSWSLLSALERSAAAQLSVFRGGFTVEAAAEVVALPAPAPWVLDWLQPLVAKSIVRAEPTVTGDLRFGMLESQRQFAQGKLEEAGTREEAEARHRRWCARLAEGAPVRVRGPDGEAFRPALAAEAENLRAAHHGALAGEPEVVVATALALDVLMELQAPTSERLALLDRAVAAASTPADLARSRLARGAVHAVRGAYDQGQADVDDALLAAGPLGDAGLLARIQDVRAELLVHQQRLEPAGEAAREALRLAIEAGERGLQASAHLKLGHVAALAGDLAAADGHFRTMRALAVDARSWRLQVRARTNLGTLARMQGRGAEAEREYEAALRIAREAGDRVLEATLLDSLGALLTSRGAVEPALERFAAALAVHRLVGGRRGEVRTLGNRGTLLLGVGRLLEARDDLHAALDLAEANDDPRYLGKLHGNLGVCLVHLDETAAARHHLEHAVRLLADRASFPEAYFSAHLAIATADHDDPDAAEVALARAEPGLGRGQPVARGLLRVAAAHIALARARAEPAGDGLAVARQRVAEAEAEAAAASSAHPGTGTEGMLPSELAAALRNLRRRVGRIAGEAGL